MHILVCTKQVPDSEAELIIDAAVDRVRFAGQPAFKMNRYDAFALETALQIRSGADSATVTAVTVGAAESADVVRRALGMGADHGIVIEHRQDEQPGPGAIAAAIASLVERDRYDLVLTGALSEDDMNAAVGAMIAGCLDWPCLTNVAASEKVANQQVLRVESEIEGGHRDLLEISLPAVLTIQTGGPPPRYPKLSLMLKANQYQLEVLDLRAMAAAPRRERTVRVEYPRSARKSVYVSGTLEDKVEEVIRILTHHGLLA